jgi:hypothetical protein
MIATAQAVHFADDLQHRDAPIRTLFGFCFSQ